MKSLKISDLNILMMKMKNKSEKKPFKQHLNGFSCLRDDHPSIIRLLLMAFLFNRCFFKQF